MRRGRTVGVMGVVCEFLTRIEGLGRESDEKTKVDSKDGQRALFDTRQDKGKQIINWV